MISNKENLISVRFGKKLLYAVLSENVIFYRILFLDDVSVSILLNKVTIIKKMQQCLWYYLMLFIILLLE